MARLRSVYRLINILSIDIAVGALCCALFLSYVLGVDILIYGLTALVLTVWIIYTADHLRDAKVIGPNASSARHQFHFRHRKALSVLLMAAVVIDAVVIIFMRKAVFYYGAYLFLLVVLYLAAQKHLKLLKEMFIAVLYTCGVLLPSVSVTVLPLNAEHYLLFFQLVIVAWVNLLMFSWFDYDQDMREKQHSFVTTVGRKSTSVGLIVITSCHAIILLFQIWSGGLSNEAWVLFVMNVALLIVFKAYREKDKELFRWLGDAVFFIPGMFWLWRQL